VDPGKKNSIFPGAFPNFDIFRHFQKYFDFSRRISDKFRFFQAIFKIIQFSRQKLLIYSYVWPDYSISL